MLLAYFIMTLDGIIQSVSLSAPDLLGYSKAEPVGEHADIIFSTFSEDGRLRVGSTSRLIESFTEHIGSCIAIDKAGSQRQIQVGFTQTETKDGPRYLVNCFEMSGTTRDPKSLVPQLKNASSVHENLQRDMNLKPSADEPAIGTMFADRLEILNFCGEGRTSRIYKARNVALGVIVAVKILRSQLAHDASVVKSFQREARNTVMLHHPQILTVFDFGITKTGLPYLVTEFVDGETLEHNLSSVGTLQLNRVLNLFNDIAEVLMFCHRQSISHGALNAREIMLVPDESAVFKLIDFGESFTIREDRSASPEKLLEQRFDFDASCQRDLFAFGSMLFQSMTGEPFSGTYDVLAEAPDWLVDVIVRSTTIDAAERTSIAEICRIFQEQMWSNSTVFNSCPK